MEAARRTQVWLAVSQEPAAKVTSEYFYHMQLRSPLAATRDIEGQDRLLDACKNISGINLPL